MDYPFKTF